jgi:PAS domain S-box-containing protein
MYPPPHPAGPDDHAGGQAGVGEREDDFRRLLESLPASAYTCDAGGLITYYNQRAVELWGRAPALHDPVDRYCGSFRLFDLTGEPISHDACWMALALRERREFSGREIVIERPDGQRMTALAHATPMFDAAGELVGAVNVLVDISARSLVENALEGSEVQLRRLNRKLEARVEERTSELIEANRENESARNRWEVAFRLSPVASAISRMSDGQILDVNDRFARFFGYEQQELIGRTGIELGLWVDPEVRERLVAAVREAGVLNDFELAVRTRAGEERIVLGSVALMEMEGEVCALIKFVDITAARRLERAVEEAGETERRRLSYELHDDLGQRLAGANVLCFTLGEQLKGEGHPAASRAERAGELIRDAMAHARSLSRALAPVDLLSEGLVDALERLCTSTEEAYGVRCTLDAVAPSGVDDPVRATNLFRIAQEAVSNAARHAGASAMHVRLWRDGHELVLEVHDDGAGVPAEMLHGHGGGMGLRTMRSRAAAHGGELSIVHESGGGTTVRCRLPAPTGAPVAAPTRARSLRARRARR